MKKENALLIIEICVIALLSSCTPSRQATKHYAKAKYKDLPTVAKLARQDFPCIEKSSDTSAPKRDTTIRTDTIWQVKKDTIRAICPDGTVIETVHDTKYYDINREKVINNDYYITKTVKDSADGVIIRKLEDKNLVLTSGRSTWRWIGIIAIIIALVSLFFNFKKLFKP